MYVKTRRRRINDYRPKSSGKRKKRLSKKNKRFFFLLYLITPLNKAPLFYFLLSWKYKHSIFLTLYLYISFYIPGQRVNKIKNRKSRIDISCKLGHPVVVNDKGSRNYKIRVCSVFFESLFITLHKQWNIKIPYRHFIMYIPFNVLHIMFKCFNLFLI